MCAAAFRLLWMIKAQSDHDLMVESPVIRQVFGERFWRIGRKGSRRSMASGRRRMRPQSQASWRYKSDSNDSMPLGWVVLKS